MSELSTEQEQEAADRMLDAQIDDYLEGLWRDRAGLPPDDDIVPPDLILAER